MFFRQRNECDILKELHSLNRKADTILATLADLDTEISGELTSAVNAVVAAVTALEAKIAAGVDTSTEIANLKALAGNLQTAVASANPPAPAPAPGT